MSLLFLILGTSAPSATHLMVSLYLCSSGSNVPGESRAKEGHRVSSKSPSRVRDRDEGVAGRNGREQCFPDEGSLICPPGKSMSFHKKETEKIELVARPGRRGRPRLPIPARGLGSWGCSRGRVGSTGRGAQPSERRRRLCLSQLQRYKQVKLKFCNYQPRG